jgi:hypothetical protein
MQNNSFPLVFTAEQIKVIDQALQQAPYFVAAPLLSEINRQLEALQKAASEPPWKSAPPASNGSTITDSYPMA